jgi:cytidyltransferase-like protein
MTGDDAPLSAADGAVAPLVTRRAVPGEDDKVTTLCGTTAAVARHRAKPPPLGPEPTLLRRKEMDLLYVLLEATVRALDDLRIDYIVTGGSLLGAVRQASILFCDDDADISILDPHADDPTRSVYTTRLHPHLATALGPEFQFKQGAWEGGDRVSYKHSNVFLDIFVIRRYSSRQQLRHVLAIKANGQAQSDDYVSGLMKQITTAAEYVGQEEETAMPLPSLEPPFWHFARRKAVELWPKEVYRDWELWPLSRTLQMGPCRGIAGPRLPVLLLQRAFGVECVSVDFTSVQHTTHKGASANEPVLQKDARAPLPPRVLPGGTWQHATKTPLKDEHYLPIQPSSKARRRSNAHCRQVLKDYLSRQAVAEAEIVRQMLDKTAIATSPDALVSDRPHRTVYMDGVFDLFHVGHLAAIRHCAARGDRVILGVTGDADATAYKRQPIIPQDERCALVHVLPQVDDVVCPCPLVVTKDFMEEYGIDLVVHGFANDADAERQTEFFAYPMEVHKFERIPYYRGQSTTDIMSRIQALEPV